MKSKIFQTCSILFSLMLLCSVSVQAQDMDTTQKAFTRNADDNDLKWNPCPDFMPKSCSIAVLQGDPAKPNADVFFKMEGNTSVTQHWHNSAERMVLISGEMQVEYESQDPVVLSSGDYAYGPPQKPHNASCISDEPCVLFIAFVEPVDAFQVQ